MSHPDKGSTGAGVKASAENRWIAVRDPFDPKFTRFDRALRLPTGPGVRSAQAAINDSRGLPPVLALVSHHRGGDRPRSAVVVCEQMEELKAALRRLMIPFEPLRSALPGRSAHFGKNGWILSQGATCLPYVPEGMDYQIVGVQWLVGTPVVKVEVTTVVGGQSERKTEEMKDEEFLAAYGDSEDKADQKLMVAYRGACQAILAVLQRGSYCSYSSKHKTFFASRIFRGEDERVLVTLRSRGADQGVEVSVSPISFTDNLVSMGDKAWYQGVVEAEKALEAMSNRARAQSFFEDEDRGLVPRIQAQMARADSDSG